MSAAIQSLMRNVPRLQHLDRADVTSFFSFVGIGVTGALAFVAVSSAVIWLDTGIAAWVVNVMCYAAFIGPIYLLQRRFSFRSQVPHSRALPRYVAVQGLALMLAALFSYVMYGLLTLPTVVASLLVIGLTSGVNFIVLRGWAFARTNLMAAVA